MTRYVVAMALGLQAIARAAGADDYALRGAQRYLLAAVEQLQEAPDDRRGHRERALRAINDALEQIHLALTEETPVGQLEQKRQRREDDLERRREERDQRLDEKQQQREERMQER